MKNKIINVAAATLCALLLFSSCKKSSSASGVLQTIKNDPSLSIFSAIESRSGDDALLVDGYAYVIPTDSAFINAGMTTAAVTALNTTTCDSIVRYYIIPNGFSFSNTANTELEFGTALSNATLYADSTSSALYFNGVMATSLLPVTSGNSLIYKTSGMLNIPVYSVTQITASDPDLTLFNEAMIRTNLTANFNGNPFTLFAPTNEAFMSAGYPDVASIDSADINTLTQIMLYQVVSNRYFDNDIMQLSSLNTLESGSIAVSQNNGSVQLTGTSDPSEPASIVATAIIANNVVIYKINQLLLP